MNDLDSIHNVAEAFNKKLDEHKKTTLSTVKEAVMEFFKTPQKR